MHITMREALQGAAIGLAGGIVAGFVLNNTRNNPRRRPPPGLPPTADGEPLDLTQYRVGHSTPVEGVTGLLPDELLTEHIRGHLEGLGLCSRRLDVTTVDGTIYLRGQEPRPGHAEQVVRSVRSLAPEATVVDEIRRP